MTWAMKLMGAYRCVATGAFSGLLAHAVVSTASGIRQPFFLSVLGEGLLHRVQAHYSRWGGG